MFLGGNKFKGLTGLAAVLMMAGSICSINGMESAEAAVNIYDKNKEDGRRYILVEENKNLSEAGEKAEPQSAENAEVKTEIEVNRVKPEGPLRLVRISWDPIPGAVGYQLIITEKPEENSSQAVFVKNGIFNTGYEIDLSSRRTMWDCYWSVCPINSRCEAIGGYTEPKPMTGDAVEWDPVSPLPTTEYDKMEYSLVYPTFSWIPVNKAHSYEIRVSKEDDSIPGKFNTLRSFRTDNNIFYENAGYTWPGKYRWQVRAWDIAGNPSTQWSSPRDFVVEKHAKVAALGDSITHGGGVSSIPPNYTLYDWETYCKVPVKNIGLSGDTTQGMLERFDSEVLAFSPSVLLIMGGVNNFRAGEDAWETIDSMEKLRDKCTAHDIIPVFLTATPINENLIRNVPSIGTPASNWKYEQQVLNCWIKQQRFWIDVTPRMTDKNGRLKAEMTTDGLHPDLEGKKIIGEMVSEYLLKTFPYLDLTEK